jgi:hypothetical protein
MTDVAYIYSHDGDDHGLKFSVSLCTEDTLRETVQKHLCPDGEDLEFPALFDALSESGGHDFEDGWVVVKRGCAEIVEFLIYQMREAKAEENYADTERAKEACRRVLAETKYAALCEALIGAIDTKAPTIREIAANGGIAA